MSDCAARRKDGSPCRVRARPGRPYCAFHDPELQEQRAAGKRTGGEHKRTAHRLDRLTPDSIRPVLTRLLDAMERVDRGEMDPKQAGALASLAGAICRVYEISELEIRLRELEGQHGRTG